MSIQTKCLAIEGMTCEGCADPVRRALAQAPGRISVEVSYPKGQAIVQMDTSREDPAETDHQIEEAVASAGYRLAAAETVEGPGASADERRAKPGAHSADGTSLHFLIVGGGSAAFAAAARAAESGARVTLANDRLPIGGTCVNVGCVPSKTLIRAAETRQQVRNHGFTGIEGDGRLSDFRGMIEQKRRLVEGLRQNKYVDVISDLRRVDVIRGRARFTGPRTVEVDGRRITGDRVLIATGAQPSAPPIPGLEETGYLTNESAFELETLPSSLIVLGGRHIALECAQMFARLGSRVTILQRSAHILPTEEAELTRELTALLEEEGVEVVTDVQAQQVRREGQGVVVEAEVGGERKTFRAEHLLLATGRRGNTDGMALENTGIHPDRRGFIATDEHLRAGTEGVYAAGDVTGSDLYVYVAAYEGGLAAENAIRGTDNCRDVTPLPWVIFTNPQVCGVGLDEGEAREQGFEVDVAKLPMSHVPRRIVAHDTRGFFKLVRDRATDKLLGARILAPEGSELLMELTLAIRFRMPVEQLKECFHPYLTLGEAVKLALLAFDRDVRRLSCCAT